MKLEGFAVGSFQVNTYILWDEETLETYIIDPGGENYRILEVVEKNKLNVKAIINTHGHIDHIAGIPELQKDLQIPFYIHEADVPVVQQSAQAAQMFGIDFTGNPKIDGYLTDGQILTLGKNEIEVLHTPGHSPGGVCFKMESDVLVGDTLFANSIGRTDLPGGSYSQLLDSIQKKLMVLDDNMRVYPGHMGSTTIGHEKKFNPFCNQGNK